MTSAGIAQILLGKEVSAVAVPVSALVSIAGFFVPGGFPEEALSTERLASSLVHLRVVVGVPIRRRVHRPVLQGSQDVLGTAQGVGVVGVLGTFERGPLGVGTCAVVEGGDR